MDGIACLYGASTIDAFRRRGVQGALPRARLQWIRERGDCGFALIQAQPGTTSERNIAGAGFRLAYTRVRMIKDCL